MFGLLVVVSMFAFNYSVSLPKLADERWGGEDNFGWVLAVTSIGSLTGSLLTARLRRVPLNWMLISMVVLGVGGIGMAWAPNLAMAFAWSIPLGVGGAGFITAANAISQQESPSDMRSRLMALQAVAFLGSTPIGSPITGWIADTVSAPWSLAYGGVISLLCAVGRVGLSRRRGRSTRSRRWLAEMVAVRRDRPRCETDRVPATIEDFEPFIDDVHRRSAVMRGTVELVVCRPAVGERRVLDAAELEPGRGLVGDNYVERGEHAGPPTGWPTRWPS